MVGSALHRDSKERYKPIVWLPIILTGQKTNNEQHEFIDI